MSNDIKPPTRALGESTSSLQNTFKKLASGKRINSAADDAAGLAIAKSIESDIGISRQGRRNTNDASSALAIADGAYSQLNDISGRMSELATQAGNSLLSGDQRTALDNEFQQLRQESQRIASTTEFNGVKLLSGESISVQVGNDSSASSSLSLNSADIKSLTQSLDSSSLSSQDGAKAALDSLKSFVTNVSQTRGTSGAFASRLDYASNAAAIGEEGLAKAQSQIEDYDYAQGVADKTSAAIRQDVSASLTGQASRLNGQAALSLLS